MPDLDSTTECDICGRRYNNELATCSICHTCCKAICIYCETSQRNADGRRVGHELAEHLHDWQES